MPFLIGSALGLSAGQLASLIGAALVAAGLGTVFGALIPGAALLSMLAGRCVCFTA